MISVLYMPPPHEARPGCRWDWDPWAYDGAGEWKEVGDAPTIFRLLVKAGQRVASIKWHRQTTRCGLREARDFVLAVEAGERHYPIAQTPGYANPVNPAVVLEWLPPHILARA